MKITIGAALCNIYLWFTTSILQIGPVDGFVVKYLFADIQFLKWLMIIMFVDLMTGIAKVIKNEGWKCVTSKGLRDTVSKCIQYGAFLIVTHVITHYQIGGKSMGEMAGWIMKIACEFVILIEVKSVYENLVAINPKLDFVTVLVAKVVKLFPANEKKDQ